VKILYVSLSYLPSRRASSVQVMRMCNAFAQHGHEVTLLAKRQDEQTTEGLSVHEFYGVPRSFELELLARPKRRGGGLVYALEVARRVLAQRRRVDLVYCRDLIGAEIASELGLPVAFEAHGVPLERWQRAIWRRILVSRKFVGLVAISKALVGVLRDVDLLPHDRPIVVAHSAADRIGESTPRATVGSPPRIGYVGNLYRGRGIELVIELARAMPDRTFELVGGTDADLSRLRESGLPLNLVLHGFVAPARLATLYRQFDVLLMPYPRTEIRGASNKIDTSAYCSPMKMFEYMASGVPMISSDLPVLQEVLGHERNALIARADDPLAWGAAIDRLVTDRGLRVRLANQALADLEEHTSDVRVTRVLGGLGLC
jgi:glycosyltransferase involved in cell wall biosynthesis